MLPHSIRQEYYELGSFCKLFNAVIGSLGNDSAPATSRRDSIWTSPTHGQIQAPSGCCRTKRQERTCVRVQRSILWRKDVYSDMHVCLSCNHFLVFHRPSGGDEPCFLCPPTKCLVEGCRCNEYDGVTLTDRPHEEHKSMQVLWGSWGFVVFSNEEDRTFVSGAEPPVERAGVRISPSTQGR